MAGYSGTPLLKKLGIKKGFSMLIINKPKNYTELIGELPDKAREVNSNSKEIDFIHVFAKSSKEFQESLRAQRTIDEKIWG